MLGQYPQQTGRPPAGWTYQVQRQPTVWETAFGTALKAFAPQRQQFQTVSKPFPTGLVLVAGAVIVGFFLLTGRKS